MQAGVSAEDCIRFALTLPVSTLVVGIESMADLKQDIAIARNFKSMPEAEKNTLLSRIREEASDGRHELFKSTKAFDGPHHRKQHGFDTGVA
jgi:predicted aldo/keto reductase-like oxidoreductase